jgi:hypothetical protein
MLDCISLQGIHLDPSIYLMDEEKRDDNSRTGKTIPDSKNSGISVERKTEHESKNGLAENDTYSVPLQSIFGLIFCLPFYRDA